MTNPFLVSIERYNELADAYASRFNDVSDYALSLDVFCNELPSNAHILELACGPGNISSYLIQKLPDSKIFGIDLAPAMIEIAKKKVPQAEFTCMDVKSIHTLSEVFDGIMISFYLPYIYKSEVRGLLENCKSLSTPGGVIYISTMEGDESMASFQTTSFSGNLELYFNFHRREDIINEIENAGFKIVHFRPQDYKEPDGSVSTDLIFVASKI